MKIGYVGLGKMGLRMSKKLKSTFDVVGYDKHPDCLRTAEKSGIECVDSLKNLVTKLNPPRIVWIMVNSGAAVDDVILTLLPFLTEGDVLIDGGNAHYEDSQRRRSMLEQNGIGFLGAGTSGGLEGAENSPPISVDGSWDTYQKAKGLFEALGNNHTYFADSGKGHLAKTIHNAIEYGIMQSIAEGVALYVRHGFSQEEIRSVFKTWSKGSIIESKLVTRLIAILNGNNLFDQREIKKSETIELIKKIFKEDLPTPAIYEAVKMRENPEKLDQVSHTVLALLRKDFGGHEVK
jgi:6-phosphogluconate dehydrogenase